jgi:hypothetical protein
MLSTLIIIGLPQVFWKTGFIEVQETNKKKSSIEVSTCEPTGRFACFWQPAALLYQKSSINE